MVAWLPRARGADSEDSIHRGGVGATGDGGLGLESHYGASIWAQTDMTALKEFCDAKIEFPTHCLERSGASETAVKFVMTLLVAQPHARASAEEARQNGWLLEQEQQVSPLIMDHMIAVTDTQAIIEPPRVVRSESITALFLGATPPFR